MAYEVPPLPYDYDALEPHIDEATMRLHHDKHHAAYVNNLNMALEKHPELFEKSAEELLLDLNTVPEDILTAVKNNAGGHVNHSMFWQMMKKDGGGEPTGELAKVLDQSFGSFSGFRDKFTEAATKVFGSGWAWLVLAPDKKLYIEASPNQDSPVTGSSPGKSAADAFAKRYGLKPEEVAKSMALGKIPLLGLDVWEHAYYLKYQNRRPDYITAWWNVVNWKVADERFGRAK